MAGQGADNQYVTLKGPRHPVERIRKLGLPERITLRLVRLPLHTGESEVLATSLWNEKTSPISLLAEVYHLRWGIETFFSILKTRLPLENFTGNTLESVPQDFYSTIYISGLESLLTTDVNEYLA